MKPKRSFQCDLCGEAERSGYMVHPHVWAQAMPTPEGLLHLNCLEIRLGRPLTVDDFTAAPGNEPLRFGYAMAKRESQEKGP